MGVRLTEYQKKKRALVKKTDDELLYFIAKTLPNNEAGALCYAAVMELQHRLEKRAS